MSSLGVSLVLLLSIAIVIAVACNLRQGSWPRWERSLRRALGALRGAGRNDRPEPATRREATGNGRRSAERGEPRLGADAGPESAAGFADLDESDAQAGLPQVADNRQAAGGQSASGYEERARVAPPAQYPDAEGFDSGDRTVVAPASAASPRPAAGGAAAASSTVFTASGASAPAGATARPASPASPPLAGQASPSAGADTRARASAEALPATSDRGDAGPDVREPAASPTVAPATPGPLLSEACDCVVELVPASPLAGGRVLAIAQRFRRAGSKPVAFDARSRADDEGFEPLAAGRSYELVRVGVLMANRHGPLNAMEFSEFVSAVQAIAETLSAQAEMPAMGSALARARDLDSTCAQLDVQIGVNVEAPEPVEPAQLAALAPALSLVERGSHRYVRPGPQGEALFSLAFADSPSRLTFLLDVPRVAASLSPFARMVQAANACAQRLGARLVDDSGKPLTQASLAQISRQLDQRYESLEAIGLPAGSTLACKVFN